VGAYEQSSRETKYVQVVFHVAEEKVSLSLAPHIEVHENGRVFLKQLGR
jgi:hypothetical protein